VGSLGKAGLRYIQMLMIPPRSRGLVEIDLVDIVGPGGQNVGLEFLKQDNFLSKSWMLIASEHLKQGRLEMADRTLLEGLGGEQHLRRYHGRIANSAESHPQYSSSAATGMGCAKHTRCWVIWRYYKPKLLQRSC
jgi:hypothetical protein